MSKFHKVVSEVFASYNNIWPVNLLIEHLFKMRSKILN